MAAALGKDGVLSYKAGGVSGSGSWVPITLARDVTVNLASNLADATSRASGGFEQQVVTTRKLEVDTEILWDNANAAFSFLADAAFANTVIGLQSLDGTGGDGFEFDAYVADFTRNEPLTGPMTATVKFVSAPSATAPAYVEGT